MHLPFQGNICENSSFVIQSESNKLNMIYSKQGISILIRSPFTSCGEPVLHSNKIDKWLFLFFYSSRYRFDNPVLQKVCEFIVSWMIVYDRIGQIRSHPSSPRSPTVIEWNSTVQVIIQDLYIYQSPLPPWWDLHPHSTLDLRASPYHGEYSPILHSLADVRITWFAFTWTDS